MVKPRSPSIVDQWHDHIQVSSPIPCHAQLQGILELHLYADGYRIGDLLPSEMQLASRFNLSRATVRRAVDALVAAGLVRRHRGVRTVLIRQPSSPGRLDGLMQSF